MIVAATGHRPNRLGGYGRDAAKRLDQLAFDWLEFIGPDKAISGLALGWDQAFARAAIRLGIPVIGAVPFVGQESKWPAASQRDYVELLGQCSEVVMCTAGHYTAFAMHVRNEWMVDHADLICALWNGEPGGTGNCVAYARRRDRSMVNLWTLYGSRQT